MRTRYRKILVAAGATLASMALLASAAEATTPAPPYQDFAGCPSKAENPFVASCLKFTFSGGSIGIGNREVPITNPIVFRGGDEQITGNFIFNGEGGIVPVKQTVPGGLIGLTGLKWLDEVLGSQEALKLYATVELAGTPGSVSGSTLALPVKIHLENPFLGESCDIGSAASPIDLDLGIAKEAGELEPEVEREQVYTTIEPGEYADADYAVPGANGCQLKIGSLNIPIDELVDSAYKLPAAAGTNETNLDFSFSVVPVRVVYP